jgi:hypothetical protein
MICYFFAGFSGAGAGSGAGCGAEGGVMAGCAAGAGGENSFFFSHPKRAITTMIRTRIKTEYFFTKLYLLNEF